MSQRLAVIKMSSDVQNLLSETICQRSQGLFLYARLIAEQIVASLHKNPSTKAQDLAETLSIGLNEMYNDMLNRAAALLGETQDIQIFILRLTTLATRPLRLNELAAALTFTKLLKATLRKGKA